MNDLDHLDQDTADVLRSGFAGAAYTRPASTLRRPSRAPVLIGATAAVALVATAVAVTSDGSRSPALAWSPTPRQADAGVTEQALRKCSLPAAPTGVPGGVPDAGVTGSGVVVAQALAAGAPEGAQPAAGTDQSGSAVIEAGGGDLQVAGAVPAGSGGLPVIDLPTELPPLVALDVRGTGALATFADDRWVAQCMLLPGDGGFDLGIVSMTSAGGQVGAVGVIGGGTGVGTGSAMVGSASGEGGDFLSVGMTQLPDGSKVSTALGGLPEGTARVVAEVPGVEPAEASITGSWFSLWWEGGTGGGFVRGYDASGAEVWSRPLPSMEAPPAMPAPATGG